jgi:hypothetical protein
MYYSLYIFNNFSRTYADHTDEVRTIIQKATKDVAIESSLKTYEEVWLSKVFELKRYKKARVSSAAIVTGNQEVLIMLAGIHCYMDTRLRI